MTRSDSFPPPAIGCAGFGPGQPLRRYFDQLGGVELIQTFINPPKLATLQRWRSAAPDGFVFVVRAWQLTTHLPSSPTYRQLPGGLIKGPLEGAGHLQDSEVVQQGLAGTVEVAEALDATAVLFETPASFTPTTANRAALARFFERCDRGRGLVWSPAGLWDPREVAQICRDLRLLFAWDPFAGPTDVDPDAVYVRPLGLGGAQHTDGQLRWLAERLSGPLCMFGAPSLFADAQRLRELLRST